MHSQQLVADDKVRVPQVWFLRHGAEVRRVVRAAAEHHQREDLRLPLVLVRHRLHHHRHSGQSFSLTNGEFPKILNK